MNGLYLAALLRRRRQALGLSVQAAAAKADMSYWSYYTLERRGWQVRPNPDVISRIAEALETPESILWDATGCTAPATGSEATS